MKYHEYIQKNIFKPLEMQTACFTREDFDKVQDKMTAYKTEKEDLKETIHPFDEFIYAAGGILCSVNELKNYLLMYLSNGKFKENELVSTSSIEKMFTPAIKSNLGGSDKIHYGYGWAIEEDFLGEKIIAHGGSTAVSSAYVSLMPSKKIGIAIVANCGNSQGALISQAIMSLLLNKNPMKEIPALQLDNKLSVLCGKYKTYRGLTEIEVIKKGPFLYMKQPEKETIDYHLVPKSLEEDNYQFYIPNGIIDYPIEFLVDKKKGKVILLFERNALHKI
jgi:hypothetical protein